MGIILLSLAFLSLMRTNVQAAAPHGLDFVGVGYNLMKGNPDEGTESYGGVDPGIRTTHRIFQLTSKDSAGIPVEIAYFSRSSCASSTVDTTYHGAKSYQKKLEFDVKAEASGGIPKLFSYAFAANAKFKREKHETEEHSRVYHEEKERCNYGAARYKFELAQGKHFQLSEGFQHAVCQLPQTVDRNKYMGFIDAWGTHVIMKVDLGIGNVKRSETKARDVIKSALIDDTGAVELGGSYQGHKASLKLDWARLDEKKEKENWKSSKTWTFHKGTKEAPEPIVLEIQTIDSVLQPYFWTKSPCGITGRLTQMKSNLHKALEAYPQWLGLELPLDPIMRIPLSWPRGSYGLPQTKLGCPAGDSKFNWKTGSRTQTVGRKSKAKGAGHLPKDMVSKYTIKQSFCIKASTGGDFWWQPGKYCIFKVGECPSGFQTGYIKWDDYGSKQKNLDKQEGALPDGKYTKHTKIEYCCRSDGVASHSIYLPTDKPFYLLAVTTQCQEVHGMKSSKDVVTWDTNIIWNKDEVKGSTPLDTAPSRTTHQLTYCHYAPT